MPCAITDEAILTTGHDLVEAVSLAMRPSVRLLLVPLQPPVSPKIRKLKPCSAPAAAFVIHIEPRAPFEYRKSREP
jgi:hypothetical protein